MKIIVFLAEGFEEIEALTVVDYLRRLDGIEVDMVSITQNLKVIGAHNIEVMADKTIGGIEDLLDYDGLVIPGGMPGATNLRDSKKLIDIVKDFNEKDKLIAAICAGPIVFEEADVIKGRDITSYPGFEENLKSGNYLEKDVVLDGNLLTSRGPALAIDFTFKIVEYLLGNEKVESLKKDILYRKE